jgi:hypothetical protein
MFVTLRHVVTLSLFLAGAAATQSAVPPAFSGVPELPHRVAPDFFEVPPGAASGETSAVALNSTGNIFIFQLVNPMLAEYNPHRKFLHSIGDGLFDLPMVCESTPTTTCGRRTTAITSPETQAQTC